MTSALKRDGAVTFTDVPDGDGLVTTVGCAGGDVIKLRGINGKDKADTHIEDLVGLVEGNSAAGGDGPEDGRRGPGPGFDDGAAAFGETPGVVAGKPASGDRGTALMGVATPG